MQRSAIDSNSPRTACYGVPRSSSPAMRGTNYPNIATENLRLRAFGLADIATLVATANEHHVADTSLDFPCPFTAKYAQHWIRSHPAAWHARDAVHWAVSSLANNRLVGYTRLHNIDLEERQGSASFLVG